jgi:hypothetical protein
VEELERQGGIRAAALARRDLGLAAHAGLRPVEARTALVRAARSLLQLDVSAARPALAGLAHLARDAGDQDLARRLAGRARERPEGQPPTSVEDDRRVAELITGIDPAPEPGDDDELLRRCEGLGP